VPADGHGPPPKKGTNVSNHHWRALYTANDPFHANPDFDIPINVYLCDWIAYIAVHLYSPADRYHKWSGDFGAEGQLKANRVPLGEPVTIYAHGKHWYLVVNVTYILLGEEQARSNSWVLSTKRNIPHRWKTKNGCQVGLVLAPNQSPIPALALTMTYHFKPSKDDDAKGVHLAIQRAGTHDIWMGDVDKLVLDLDRRRVLNLRELAPDDLCNFAVEDTDKLEAKPGERPHQKDFVLYLSHVHDTYSWQASRPRKYISLFS
jgi:hypothetical protein